MVIEEKEHAGGDRIASLVALDSLCWDMAAGDAKVFDVSGFVECLGQLWICPTLWRHSSHASRQIGGLSAVCSRDVRFNY